MSKCQNVVVIGGGIAGTSIARVLASSGVRATLLEKSGQLCSGATWHAAGLVTRFAGSAKLKKIHTRSLEVLTDLHAKYGIGLHTPGSIRIIEKGNKGRLYEAKHHVALASLFETDSAFKTQMIGPDEISALHPLVDISDVECGVYTPHDGDVDPTSLTNCLAQLAKQDGAEFRFRQEVTHIDIRGPNDFVVHTDSGEVFHCDTIVNAAGLWSRNISDMIPGTHHPAFVIEHQYAITEPVQEIVDFRKTGRNNGRLPVLRDLRGSSYIRQEGDGFLIGPYEEDCVVRTDLPRGPASDFEMELFPDALDRLEDCLVKNMDLVPCLAKVGFRSIVNGPTIWTGDSMARVGRTTLPGYYDFNSLSYGIAQGYPLAEYLGHIMLQGEQPWDATDYFDPLRYGNWANDTYTVDKIKETYVKNNCVVYNYENRSGGRGALPPPYPLYDTVQQHGALFGSVGGSGVEVPFCYDPTGQLTIHDQHTFHSFTWVKAVEAEVQHVLKQVGLSYSSFSKIRITGTDSKALLRELTTAPLPVLPVTTDHTYEDLPCKLTYACTPTGKVLTEFTVCRFSADEWYLVGSRDRVRQDLEWLRRNVAGRDVKVTDMTNQVCVLHVMGPKSGHLLGAVEPRIANLPFMRLRPLQDFAGLSGVSVNVMRVSFTGEMGFELHFSSNDGPAVHDSLWNHPATELYPLRHVGSAAINSFRIEKGFKLMVDIDFAHYTEANITPFVKKKGSFLGKDSNLPGPTRQAAMFQVDTTEEWRYSVVGDSPVHMRDGTVVGFTTSSTRGASTGTTVALGYLYPDYIGIEEPLLVSCFGHDFPARVISRPLCDLNRDVWPA